MTMEATSGDLSIQGLLLQLLKRQETLETAISEQRGMLLKAMATDQAHPHTSAISSNGAYSNVNMPNEVSG